MEGFSDWAKDHIDLDAVFEEIKDLDGRGILADWDGEELELPNDFYAYRINQDMKIARNKYFKNLILELYNQYKNEAINKDDLRYI